MPGTQNYQSPSVQPLLLPMPRKKAIEILANAAHHGIYTFDQDFKDAIVMALAALTTEELNLSA